VWISLEIVLEEMPELIARDFGEYFKNGSGRDAKGSIFFLLQRGQEDSLCVHY